MQPLPASFQFAKLMSQQKNVQPVEFVLDTEVCTLGRSPMCDVVVTQQKTVSRLHAKIELEGPRYILYDANSANGTFVNGHRTREPYLLKHEDDIGLGTPTAMLRFNDPDPTAPVQGLLHFDDQAMFFFLNNKKIELTPHQLRFLHHLYQHAGDVCTRESCAEAVWKRDFEPGPDYDNLDRIVSNIRSKLRRLDPTLDPAGLIKTRRGLGFELIL